MSCISFGACVNKRAPGLHRDNSATTVRYSALRFGRVKNRQCRTGSRFRHRSAGGFRPQIVGRSRRRATPLGTGLGGRSRRRSGVRSGKRTPEELITNRKTQCCDVPSAGGTRIPRPASLHGDLLRRAASRDPIRQRREAIRGGRVAYSRRSLCRKPSALKLPCRMPGVIFR